MRCTTQKDGWTCQCESYRLGRKACQHMMTAFILAASDSRVSKKKTRLNFELPERMAQVLRVRRRCMEREPPAEEDVRAEGRNRGAEAKTEEAGAVTADRYSCNACGRRFTDRPGFEGRHYSEDAIPFALRLISRNMLPKDAADTIREVKAVKVSSRAIQRWADHYPRLVEAFSENLETKGCNAVSVGEKHYLKGQGRVDGQGDLMATRFILASDHWPDKLNCDTTPFLENLVERRGGPPPLLLSDKLRGYKTGYKNTMRTEPKPATMRMPDAAVNKRHVNNNGRERHNADAERRKKDSARIQLRRPPDCSCQMRYATTSSGSTWGWAGWPPPRRRALQYRGPTSRSPRFGVPSQPALVLSSGMV